MNRKLLIIGGEGHGGCFTSCILDNQKHGYDTDIEICGFVNDFDEQVMGYPVVGKTADIPKLIEEGYYFAWAVHLIGRNKKTHDFFLSLNIPIDRLVTVIHHSAFLGENVVIEPGCLVMCFAYIAHCTRIGMCTMVKSHAKTGHHVDCGMLSHLAASSWVGSYSKLGTCCNVAIQSTIVEKHNMGDYAMLGAHSLLTKDIPAGEIHVGCPARFLKNTKLD